MVGLEFQGLLVMNPGLVTAAPFNPNWKNSSAAAGRKPLKRCATVVKKDVFSVHVQ